MGDKAEESGKCERNGNSRAGLSKFGGMTDELRMTERTDYWYECTFISVPGVGPTYPHTGQQNAHKLI